MISILLKIDLDALTSGYVFGPVNNDSMYHKEFNPAPLWPSYEKFIPVSFDFKEKAVKINIEEGTLWILKITAPTAYQLGNVNFF